MKSLQAPPSQWLQKIAIDFSCLFQKSSTTVMVRDRERKGEREVWVTRRGQKGGAEEEDGAGNRHKKVRPLRRKGRQEQTWSGGKNKWRERAAREREQGGGCAFPSWLLLIFCKPQSASAISIHFLHLSLPFSSLPPPALSSDTLLTHPPPPHTLHHFITIPPSHRSISLSAGLSLFYIFLMLYRTAPTFPFLPYRAISIYDLHHPLFGCLSLFNYLFLFHVQMEKHRREWENSKAIWKNRW